MVQNLFDHLLPRAPRRGRRARRQPGRAARRLRLRPRAARADPARTCAPGASAWRRIGCRPAAAIEDVAPGDVVDARGGYRERIARSACEALADGRGGGGHAGRRRRQPLDARARAWSRRSTRSASWAAGTARFIEIHLAKSRRIGRAVRRAAAARRHHQLPDARRRSSSYLRARRATTATRARCCSRRAAAIGLRMVPMERDLRFAWEEMPQQVLDEQAQKVRESLHAALIGWAQQAGEGSDYTDNVPMQCLHPVGHWYEVPNLLRNGVLARLLDERPAAASYLMVHNIDTLGADLDPALLGLHIAAGRGLTSEVIARQHRGSRRRAGARRRPAAPGRRAGAAATRRSSSRLSYYNTLTTWIDIDRLLGVVRPDPRRPRRRGRRSRRRVRALAARMPTYVTLKDVKKRWGKGQEDVFPVAQFEKLWGDMTGAAGVGLRLRRRAPRRAASSSRSRPSSTAGCATARRLMWKLCAIGEERRTRSPSSPPAPARSSGPDSGSAGTSLRTR